MNIAHYSNEDIYGDLDDCCKKADTNVLNDNISNHSNETEVPSDFWLDDEDVLTLPLKERHTDTKHKSPDLNTNELDCVSTSIVLKDSLLKMQEFELLNELVVTEAEQKKAKENNEKECEKLRKEIEKMQKRIVTKNEQISELSTQNINLKKNICSLYKTAKSEIELKDSLLRETHRKLDKLGISYNSLKIQRSKEMAVSSAVVESRSRERNVSSSNKDQCNTSRKRNLSPSEKTEQCEKQRKKFNRITKENYHSSSQNVHSDPNNLQSFAKFVHSKQCIELASYQSKPLAKNISSNDRQHASFQRDLTKTDAMFFKLLPEGLRKSFQEYERTQIVSLNRLKQSFVNYYFSNVANNASNELSGPSSSTDVISENIPSALFNSLFRYCNSERHLYGEFKSQYDEEGNSSCSTRMREDIDGEILESAKNDIVKLYMYRKEKLPFLVKRKFGLLKKPS